MVGQASPAEAVAGPCIILEVVWPSVTCEMQGIHVRSEEGAQVAARPSTYLSISRAAQPHAVTPDVGQRAALELILAWALGPKP